MSLPSKVPYHQVEAGDQLVALGPCGGGYDDPLHRDPAAVLASVSTSPQIAKLAGATVIGTVGTAGKEKRALDFGADLVINRAEQDFEDAVLAFTAGKPVDKIIDSTGASILDRSFALIRPLGHVVSYGEAEGKPYDNLWECLVRGSLTFTRLHVGHLGCRSDAWTKGAEAMLAHLRDGSIEVPIEGIFP